MLRGLEIRDLLIIDRLEMEFQPGLNVLTGETGAGKSILLDALGFVLGWRGRAELVRAGAEQGEVTAVFDLPDSHAAEAVLEEAGLPIQDGLFLRRVNSRDGRKSAFVNDRRCSGEILRKLSDLLVEVHGQHDDRGLLNPGGHRRILDGFAGASAELASCRAAWNALGAARGELQEASEALTAARAEEDFLRHSVSELDALAPEPGEEATLDARRRLMQAAGKIGEDIARAQVALGREGAEGRLGDALRWLEGVADKAEGRLAEPVAAVGRAMAEVAEAEQGVARCIGELSFDQTELERTEERLFAIRALARKHATGPDDLSGLAGELRSRLARLEGGEAGLKRLEAAASEAEAAYQSAAAVLSERRVEAARRLDEAMAAELAPLKMEKARFGTEVASDRSGADGIDAVAFSVATNPGSPPGPLNRIASGGELSRFMLALKICLTLEATPTTMIFDEIDRGVGGATADAVGRRLARLAERAQVIVVTHSPQVAARGHHHWRVAKRVADEMTFSSVAPLADADRVDEIARMLSGDKVTDDARAAARALLAG